MKKGIIFLAGIFSIFFVRVARAAHIIGGQISYLCEGNERYQLVLKIYRDCNGEGANFDSETEEEIVGQLTVYKGNSPRAFASINLKAPVITWLEPDLSDQCIATPPDVCVQEGVYYFAITLPQSDQSYHLTYQRCCRNNTINNIYEPGNTGATYTVEITPEAQSVCNNSPVFSEYPPIAICVNEPLQFDHSATDVEGDSLVYEFCSPLKGGHLDDLAPDPDGYPPYEAVDFVSPTYSPGRPLGGDPVVKIDARTGKITGIPRTTGQFVVGICVREYRKGVLLSTIQRDFQFNVVSCNFKVTARLNGQTTDGQNYHYDACVDAPVQMLNESYHSENIEGYRWQFTTKDGKEFISDERDLTMLFTQAGSYGGSMIVNPGGKCTDTAYARIEVHPLPTIQIGYQYDSCSADPVLFHLYIPSGEDSIVNWWWDFGDGNSSLEMLPAHQYEEAGIYEVDLLVRDANGCEGNDATEISWKGEPPITWEAPPPAAGCTPLALHFDQLAFLSGSGYTVEWNFGDSTVSDKAVATHTYLNPGIYDLSVKVSSPNGCIYTAKYPQWIKTDHPPVAAFDYTPRPVTKLDEIRFIDQSERAIAWHWDFGPWGQAGKPEPALQIKTLGSHRVRLVVRDQFDCADTTTQTIDVTPVYNIYVPNAFSPNGDNVNDSFRAFSICPLQQFHLKIFDRWGALVYESTDMEESWDGYLENELHGSSVFVWEITYVDENQKRILKGDVTLIR